MIASMMRPGRIDVRRRRVVGVLGLVVSVVGLWLVLRGVDVDATLRILSRVQLPPLAIVLAVLGIQLWIRAVRWTRLLPPGERGSIAARRLVPVLLVGYLGNAVLPARLGDALRGVLVARRESIPVAAGLGSIVLERSMDTLVVALLVLPAAALSGAPGWLVGTAAVPAALAGVALGVAQTSLPARAVGWLRRRVAPEGASRGATWLDRAGTFVETLRMNGRRRAFGEAVALTLVAWVLDAAIYWAVAGALLLAIVPAGAMLASVITVLGTAVPSAPGYLGTFELAASAVVRLLGVAPEAALAFALLAHAMTVLPLAIGGAVALMWLGVPLRATSREVAAG